MESINRHRLSRSVAPSRYDLRLRPDIDAASFAGTVSISATVIEAVDQVVLNAIELEIVSAEVRHGGRSSRPAIVLDAATERLTLQLDNALAPGEIEIVLAFNGTLNDKLRGFYRSTFIDDDGAEHTIATTQFESTNARRCFPCWDEPDRKAVFEVTLDVPDHMLAVSAMSEASREELDDGWKRLAFAPTPLMSTYLLAFVVGDLEASKAVDVDGVPVRIIHRPGRGDEVTFALDAAVFSLRWLTEYFGVPYFGDKIDLLAVPDFAFGAMENTGCVTFREVLLLVDPDMTTQPEQQRSVAVIAHELAHMWFGNLVTMQWWEGLWLKEAFATFMETAVTDAYRPDWKVWESFSLERTAAYNVDALHSTRAIEYIVESPADAEGMYDVLTYEKGASVVRMLEQYVGADRFREGIQIYMRRHAYGNTVTQDLWDAIEAATNLPVGDMMQQWIYQGGFPLVSASVEHGELRLEQQPFHLLERPGKALDEWKVPITVSVDGVDTLLLLDPHGRAPLTNTDATVVVDPHSHGFFRVRYDTPFYQQIAKGLMQLTAGQRYRVFDDTFDAVLAGLVSVADFVGLAGALVDETSPPVWTAVTSGFATLSHVATSREQQARVGELLAQVARPALVALGFDRPIDEPDPLVNEVRAALYSALGSMSQDAAVLAHARALFEGSVETDNASLESAAVRVVASTGDRDDFDVIFERFRNASSPQIERRYLFSLARFDDAGAMAELCERSLDGSIRSQDAAYLLGMALGNRWHGETVWRFVVDRWDEINDKVPDNAVARLLAGVQWLEHGDVAAIRAFLDTHPVPQARLAVAQHIERLEVHGRLRNRMDRELAQLNP